MTRQTYKKSFLLKKSHYNFQLKFFKIKLSVINLVLLVLRSFFYKINFKRAQFKYILFVIVFN